MIRQVVFTALLLCLILTILALIAWPRRQRRTFRQGKNALSDAQFVEKVCADPADGVAALAIRRVVAEECHVRPEDIHDSDSPEELSELMLTGWDVVGIVVSLEKELGIRVEDHRLKGFPDPVAFRFFGWKRGGYQAFGDWVRAVVQYLRRVDSEGC